MNRKVSSESFNSVSSSPSKSPRRKSSPSIPSGRKISQDKPGLKARSSAFSNGKLVSSKETSRKATVSDLKEDSSGISKLDQLAQLTRVYENAIKDAETSFEIYRNTEIVLREHLKLDEEKKTVTDFCNLVIHRDDYERNTEAIKIVTELKVQIQKKHKEAYEAKIRPRQKKLLLRKFDFEMKWGTNCHAALANDIARYQSFLEGYQHTLEIWRESRHAVVVRPLPLHEFTPDQNLPEASNYFELYSQVDKESDFKNSEFEEFLATMEANANMPSGLIEKYLNKCELEELRSCVRQKLMNCNLAHRMAGSGRRETLSSLADMLRAEKGEIFSAVEGSGFEELPQKEKCG